MNTYQLIEAIQQVFPNVSKNQIRLDLDTAQKLFANETGILLTKGTLSSPSSNVAWSLPTGFLRLKSFLMYDADNEPIYLEQKGYRYEIDLDKFYVFSNSSQPITSLDCTSAYIIYESLPTTLTDENTSLDIDELYRDAIESYVLSKYFAKFPIDFISNGQVVKALNLQAAQLHQSRYDTLRIKVKRLFRSRLNNTEGSLQYQHAGLVYIPQRINDATTGSTVSIAALTDLYTKYAYYKVTAEGSISPTIQIGYTTIACNVSGNTITLTSTAEFDEETIIIPNDYSAIWTRKSSSEIEFTLPAGWTTFSFEIYERD